MLNYPSTDPKNFNNFKTYNSLKTFKSLNIPNRLKTSNGLKNSKSLKYLKKINNAANLKKFNKLNKKSFKKKPIRFLAYRPKLIFVALNFQISVRNLYILIFFFKKLISIFAYFLISNVLLLYNFILLPVDFQLKFYKFNNKKEFFTQKPFLLKFYDLKSNSYSLNPIVQKKVVHSIFKLSVFDDFLSITKIKIEFFFFKQFVCILKHFFLFFSFQLQIFYALLASMFILFSSFYTVYFLNLSADAVSYVLFYYGLRSPTFNFIKINFEDISSPNFSGIYYYLKILKKTSDSSDLITNNSLLTSLNFDPIDSVFSGEKTNFIYLSTLTVLKYYYDVNLISVFEDILYLISQKRSLKFKPKPYYSFRNKINFWPLKESSFFSEFSAFQLLLFTVAKTLKISNKKISITLFEEFLSILNRTHSFYEIPHTIDTRLSSRFLGKNLNHYR